MGSRTVRLDDEAEEALLEIRRATGMTISQALKKGLLSLRDGTAKERRQTPWEIYEKLDIGPGRVRELAAHEADQAGRLGSDPEEAPPLTLLDTGPLVALFDPRDPAHDGARQAMRRERGPVVTTTPVLTEAFHFLSPASAGSGALRSFLGAGGLTVWHFDANGLRRAMELMEKYADHPMDFADASLVAAAEALRTRRILTLDQRDFAAYRVRQRHRALAFQIVRC